MFDRVIADIEQAQLDGRLSPGATEKILSNVRSVKKKIDQIDNQVAFGAGEMQGLEESVWKTIRGLVGGHGRLI